MVVFDLKDYTVKQQIGRGSFGEVHLVLHKASGRQYVLKQVRLARQNDWQRAASHLEMQLATELRHPFIVPHFESWVDRGHTIQMVHAHCAAGDLGTLLARQKGVPLPEERLKRWLAQALLALLYLQSQGVVHRDLKPPNLYLGEADELLIGDFGLAALRRPGCAEDHSIVGSAPYMSPELISGAPYTFSSDVWALGCCFYELSAQRVAFQAFGFDGLKHKVQRGVLAPLPRDYTPQWAALLRAMLSVDPTRRGAIVDLLSAPCLAAATAAAIQRVEAVAARTGCTLPQLPQLLLDAARSPVVSPASDSTAATLSLPSVPLPAVAEAASAPLAAAPASPATADPAASGGGMSAPMAAPPAAQRAVALAPPPPLGPAAAPPHLTAPNSVSSPLAAGPASAVSTNADAAPLPQSVASSEFAPISARSLRPAIASARPAAPRPTSGASAAAEPASVAESFTFVDVSGCDAAAGAAPTAAQPVFSATVLSGGCAGTPPRALSPGGSGAVATGASNSLRGSMATGDSALSSAALAAAAAESALRASGGLGESGDSNALSKSRTSGSPGVSGSLRKPVAIRKPPPLALGGAGTPRSPSEPHPTPVLAAPLPAATAAGAAALALHVAHGHGDGAAAASAYTPAAPAPTPEAPQRPQPVFGADVATGAATETPTSAEHAAPPKLDSPLDTAASGMSTPAARPRGAPGSAATALTHRTDASGDVAVAPEDERPHRVVHVNELHAASAMSVDSAPSSMRGSAHGGAAAARPGGARPAPVAAAAAPTAKTGRRERAARAARAALTAAADVARRARRTSVGGGAAAPHSAGEHARVRRSPAAAVRALVKRHNSGDSAGASASFLPASGGAVTERPAGGHAAGGSARASGLPLSIDAPERSPRAARTAAPPPDAGASGVGHTTSSRSPFRRLRGTRRSPSPPNAPLPTPPQPSSGSSRRRLSLLPRRRASPASTERAQPPPQPAPAGAAKRRQPSPDGSFMSAAKGRSGQLRSAFQKALNSPSMQRLRPAQRGPDTADLTARKQQRTWMPTLRSRGGDGGGGGGGGGGGPAPPPPDGSGPTRRAASPRVPAVGAAEQPVVASPAAVAVDAAVAGALLDTTGEVSAEVALLATTHDDSLIAAGGNSLIAATAAEAAAAAASGLIDPEDAAAASAAWAQPPSPDATDATAAPLTPPLHTDARSAVFPPPLVSAQVSSASVDGDPAVAAPPPPRPAAPSQPQSQATEATQTLSELLHDTGASSSSAVVNVPEPAQPEPEPEPEPEPSADSIAPGAEPSDGSLRSTLLPMPGGPAGHSPNGRPQFVQHMPSPDAAADAPPAPQRALQSVLEDDLPAAAEVASGGTSVGALALSRSPDEHAAPQPQRPRQISGSTDAASTALLSAAGEGDGAAAATTGELSPLVPPAAGRTSDGAAHHAEGHAATSGGGTAEPDSASAGVAHVRGDGTPGALVATPPDWDLGRTPGYSGRGLSAARLTERHGFESAAPQLWERSVVSTGSPQLSAGPLPSREVSAVASQCDLTPSLYGREAAQPAAASTQHGGGAAGGAVAWLQGGIAEALALLRDGRVADTEALLASLLPAQLKGNSAAQPLVYAASPLSQQQADALEERHVFVTGARADASVNGAREGVAGGGAAAAARAGERTGDSARGVQAEELVAERSGALLVAINSFGGAASSDEAAGDNAGASASPATFDHTPDAHFGVAPADEAAAPLAPRLSARALKEPYSAAAQPPAAAAAADKAQPYATGLPPPARAFDDSAQHNAPPAPAWVSTGAPAEVSTGAPAQHNAPQLVAPPAAEQRALEPAAPQETSAPLPGGGAGAPADTSAGAPVDTHAGAPVLAGVDEADVLPLVELTAQLPSDGGAPVAAAGAAPVATPEPSNGRVAARTDGGSPLIDLRSPTTPPVPAARCIVDAYQDASPAGRADAVACPAEPAPGEASPTAPLQSAPCDAPNGIKVCSNASLAGDKATPIERTSVHSDAAVQKTAEPATAQKTAEPAAMPRSGTDGAADAGSIAPASSSHLGRAAAESGGCALSQVSVAARAPVHPAVRGMVAATFAQVAALQNSIHTTRSAGSSGASSARSSSIPSASPVRSSSRPNASPMRSAGPVAPASGRRQLAAGSASPARRPATPAAAAAGAASGSASPSRAAGGAVRGRNTAAIRRPSPVKRVRDTATPTPEAARRTAAALKGPGPTRFSGFVPPEMQEQAQGLVARADAAAAAAAATPLARRAAPERASPRQPTCVTQRPRSRGALSPQLAAAGPPKTPLLDFAALRTGLLEGSADSPARRAGVRVGDVVMLHDETAVVGFIGPVAGLGAGEFLGLRLEAPWAGDVGATPWIHFGQCPEAPECELWVPSNRVLEQVGAQTWISPRPQA